MSKFTELENWYEHYQDTKYVTVKKIDWEIGKKGSGLIFTVPEGFVFDLTIPDVLRIIFDPHDEKYMKAACLHDYMLMSNWNGQVAAAEFNNALRAKGVGVFKRFFMWLAVSLWKWK